MIRITSSKRRPLLIAAGVLCLVAAAPPAQATWEWATGPSIHDKDGKRDWDVAIVPYLWLSGLNGQLALPGVGSIPIDVSFSSLATNLNVGLAGLIDLRYRRWHLISDNSWVRLSFKAVPDQALITSVQIEPSTAFGTVALAYELPLRKDFSVDVYLAARWWHVSTDLTLVTTLGTFSGSTAETWADAIVGSRIRYAITDHWRVSAQADIGGGNASLDWSAFASVGYDFNQHFGLTVGYRLLGVDYSNQGFVYDLRQSGLLLGLNFTY